MAVLVLVLVLVVLVLVVVVVVVVAIVGGGGVVVVGVATGPLSLCKALPHPRDKNCSPVVVFWTPPSKDVVVSTPP